MKFLLSESDVKKLVTGWDRSREFILVWFCEEPRIVITKKAREIKHIRVL